MRNDIICGTKRNELSNCKLRIAAAHKDASPCGTSPAATLFARSMRPMTQGRYRGVYATLDTVYARYRAQERTRSTRSDKIACVGRVARVLATRIASGAARFRQQKLKHGLGP